MCIPTLRASRAGQVRIQQAREQKGWMIRAEDNTPLKEASLFLMKQYAAENEWDVNDNRWLKNFRQLFRVDKSTTTDDIKARIVKSRQGSLVEKIEQFIESGEVFVKHISHGTWSRFASQGKLHNVNRRAFKAYCQVLGLNWQEIVEPSELENFEGNQIYTANVPQAGWVDYSPNLIMRNGELRKKDFHSFVVSEPRMASVLKMGVRRQESEVQESIFHSFVVGNRSWDSNSSRTSLILTGESNSSLLQQGTRRVRFELSESYDRQPSLTSSNSRPYHNLPARYHTTLIGREQEMARLLELLSHDTKVPRISIEGIGGAGKTALVLEAAYLCLQGNQGTFTAPIVPRFDAIIFTCAKHQQMIGHQFVPRQWRDRKLNDIFRIIFRTLKYSGVIPADVEEQLELIKSLLANLHTLLIIDNSETLDDGSSVLSYLYELPETVKIVITSRVRDGMNPSIYLDCLPPDQAERLIAHQAEQQHLQLKPEQSQAIYQRTSGLPLGIVYAIGQLSVYGFSSHVLTTRLNKATSDLAQYCFEDSVQHLRGQSTHCVLMALALFVKSASVEAIAQIAFSEDNFNQKIHLTSQFLHALEQLHELRLIVQHGERYDMHPLSREYALAELHSHSEFEQEARERWINWYFQFSQPYKQQDWRQWYDYQDLDQEWENLQAVIDWCIHQNRYEQVKAFWQHVKGYTYIRGYWYERLLWIDWLLQAARERQDQTMMVEVLGDKGWTLTLMVTGTPEQLAEVDALFEEQLLNLHEKQDLSLQLELIYERVILSIHQRNFECVHQLLIQWRTLLQEAELEEAKRLCQQIRIDYYEAEVCFRTGNYQQAKIGYSSALKKARVAQWQQVEVYCLNWLADIALEGEGNYKEAEQRLVQSWPMAQQGKDKRSIAFHQRSWAHLEKMKGNIPESQRWATAAKEGFENLGMLAEAREMHSWLDAEK